MYVTIHLNYFTLLVNFNGISNTTILQKLLFALPQLQHYWILLGEFVTCLKYTEVV